MFQHALAPYKGFGFDFDFDYEDDNCKTYHYVIHPDGRRELIDFSPYFVCSQEAFEAWIDAGMPDARRFADMWDRKRYNTRVILGDRYAAEPSMQPNKNKGG